MTPLLYGDQWNQKTRRRLKSRSLMIVMDMRHSVPHHRQGYEAACFGAESHYFADGSCPHVALQYKMMRTGWHRQRAWFLPFGENGAELRRVSGSLAHDSAMARSL